MTRVIDGFGIADYSTPAYLDPRVGAPEPPPAIFSDDPKDYCDVEAAPRSDEEIAEICREIGKLLGVGPGADDDKS